jgi:hypothetical protein
MSGLLAIVGSLIEWVKERRAQKTAKTAHEKDRPRFRIDVTKTKSDHAIPAFVVKILSLGSLPLTINDGEVSIKTEHYPEGVQTEKLDGREISSVCPIEISFPLPSKFTDPHEQWETNGRDGMQVFLRRRCRELRKTVDI